MSAVEELAESRARLGRHRLLAVAFGDSAQLRSLPLIGSRSGVRARLPLEVPRIYDGHAMRSDCLSDQTLALLVDGRLSPAEQEAMQLHLDACDACHRLLAGFGRLFVSPDSATSSSANASTPARSPSLERGQCLGRFRLERYLGSGGEGTVFAARDPELDRLVAIKILSHPADLDMLPRLESEGRAMARVSHPNVVAVHEVDHADDRFYLVTEFIDGETLGAWIRGGPRPLRRVVQAFIAAGRGLAAIHAAGLVHRDFKPSNVMVAADGRVCVTDFGLARVLTETPTTHGGESSPRLPSLAGTPLYMAPEVRRGAPADSRSDQYSFCAALFEAIVTTRSGSPASDAPALLRQLHEGLPLPLGGVPRWLRRILERGLAIAPEHRFPSMDALVARLEHVPRARKRSAWLSIAASSVILAGSGGYMTATRSEIAACQNELTGAGAPWNDETRSRVGAAVALHEPPYPPHLHAYVERRIEADVQRWQRAIADTCSLAPDAADHGRAACLVRSRSRLDVVVDMFAQQPPSVEALDDLLTLLEDIECGGPALAEMRDGSTTPSDLATHARIDEIVALRLAGHYEQAASVGQTVVDAIDEATQRPLLAKALVALGEAQTELVDLEVAARTLRAGVWQAEAGRADWAAASGWLELADLYGNRMQQTEEGLQHLERASAAIVRLSNDPRFESDLLTIRGSIHSAAGRFQAATDDYERALAIAGTIYDGSESLLVKLHHNLAVSRQKAGDHTRAIWHGERALELVLELRGPEHPDTAAVYNGLGMALGRSGDFDRAVPHLRRSVEISERMLGARHPDAANRRGNLGQLLMMQGNLSEAEPHIRHAVEVQRGHDVRWHAKLASALDVLAVLLNRANRPDEAIPVLTESLAIWRELHGDNHPETARILSNLGALRTRAGDARGALPLLEEAVATRRQWVRERPNEVASTLNSLGETRLALGDTAGARAAFEEALALFPANDAFAVERGSARWGLARVHEALGDEVRAASELAAARSELEKAGERGAKMLAKL